MSISNNTKGRTRLSVGSESRWDALRSHFSIVMVPLTLENQDRGKTCISPYPSRDTSL
ncbi:MAG: hypothetical protein AB1589_19190 [Cyanobacteriota bacterium]